MYACVRQYMKSMLTMRHILFQQIKICNVFGRLRAVWKWKCYCFSSILQNQFWFFSPHAAISTWTGQCKIFACKRVLILCCSTWMHKIWSEGGKWFQSEKARGRESKKRWEKRLFDRPIFDKAHHEQTNDEITLDAKITAQPTRTLTHEFRSDFFFLCKNVHNGVCVFFFFLFLYCRWLQVIRLFIWVRFAPLHPTEFIQCIVYHIPDKIKLKKCHAKRPKDICTFRCMVCALNLFHWLLFGLLMRWSYAKFATHQVSAQLY